MLQLFEQIEITLEFKGQISFDMNGYLECFMSICAPIIKFLNILIPKTKYNRNSRTNR